MRSWAFWLALVVATPTFATTTTKPPRRGHKAPLPPPVELTAINTHETFRLQPAPNGALGERQLRGWRHFLRCHHTGRTHAMAPRLAQLLYQTGRHFDRRLLVVAGYRAPKIARAKGNPKSPHKSGLACDFRVDGVSNEELRDWVRSHFNKVGVGYYPNSGFVHLDVRNRNAFWVDLSGPGERARYAEDPEEAIQTPPPRELPATAGATPDTAAPDGGTLPQMAASPGGKTPNLAPRLSTTN